MDRTIFFNTVREKPFGGSINQSQVNGCNAILDEWERRRLTDLRWLAYMLATAYHETAFTMQPIAEYGKGKGRKYGVKGKHGQVAYGRGFVQLTWDYNYEKADKELKLGGKLTANYELALDPAIAAAIMFGGMTGGWFTTKKLSDYFNTKMTDWRSARKIINGTDKAQTIANYGMAFFKALQAAMAGDVPAPEPPVQPIDAPAAPSPTAHPKPLASPAANWRTVLTNILVLAAAVLGVLAVWWWKTH